ncbi:RICIN domain-containing protein [Streptacidiphilus anmyonensis]|uniref:RICIN domain-containing protein n=1 Tax=Streptacidiphilus anmyonensis TaxID=405782 RepID=UPI0005A97F6D|nr:ricin-type beta-trefoil lectin domain protein [Streptacidiphilus anmyonensis]
MRKRLAALAAAAAPIAALTIGLAPAHADANQYDVAVFFPGNGNGYYCLDIPGNNAVVGQQLTSWPCSSNDEAERWNQIYTDSYHFELQSVTNTKLCANDWQGGDVSGNDIKLFTCNGDADGTWNMLNDNGSWQLQPRSALNNCLNIWGGLGNGNPARLFQCGDFPNEDMVWGG